MSLLKNIGQDISSLWSKLSVLINKEAAETEAILKVFVPILPQLEAEVAKIIANGVTGNDVGAYEELLALIVQIKNAAKAV